MEQQHQPVLLAVSFGTSNMQQYERSIGAVERALQRAFPNVSVCRAVATTRMAAYLREQGMEINSLADAMECLAAEQVDDVFVQPIYVTGGVEYDRICVIVRKYAGRFRRLQIGTPLLYLAEDCQKLADILYIENKKHAAENTAWIFVGHGTEHRANAVYQELQKAFTESGRKHCFVGTIKASPDLDTVIRNLKHCGAKKVKLFPLMMAVGGHVQKDIAGIWQPALEQIGCETELIYKGLGEYTGVQRMMIQHAEKFEKTEE